MGALPTVGLLSEMSMKQTELITGVGGEQGICREPEVRTVPGTGKRGCSLDWCVGRCQGGAGQKRFAANDQ
jgi:hypothetical protein